MRLRSLVSLPLAVGCLVLAAPAAQAACAGEDDVPTAATRAQAQDAVLCLINEERRDRGLRSLRDNDRLQRAATRHSSHMVDDRFFDHTTPNGTTLAERARSAGYARTGVSWSVGENLAWGTASRATPRGLVRAWMRSAPHKANILEASYRDLGVGIAIGAPVAVSGGAAGATCTANFGVRR
jgi:uncharacterized protein YkwD